LSLHESGEPGAVVPVECLQRLDLPLQRLTLGGQTPDDVLIALLSLVLEFIGIRLGVFGSLFGPHPRFGQNLVGVSPGAVRVCLGVSRYLRRLCTRLGQSLFGVPLKIVGMRPSIPNDLLRGYPCVRADLVCLMMRTGNVLLGRPLGQSKHLEGLPLGI
jgi:hypothetical protein